jgi:HK97 family phage major capsid protein
MPYEIREVYDGASEPEYCVYKLPYVEGEDAKEMQCYDNKTEAVDYLVALSAATEDEDEKEVGPEKNSPDLETLSIKSINDDSYTVAGWGVVFGGRDLEGDTFNEDTDFMLEVVPEPIVLYDHAMELKKVIGKVVKIDKQKIGLWMEAQISRSAKYAEEILTLVKAGKLGYSTGSVGHLVERLEGNIKRWGIYELSLTPTPAEPRTLGVEYLKTLESVINDASTKPEGETLKADNETAENAEPALIDKSSPITNNYKGDKKMSDNDKVVEETPEVQSEVPAIDVEGIKAELNNSVQSAIKNALESEVAERGGILTEAPAVKARTSLGGDHDGGDAFMDWARTGDSNYYTKSNLKAALQEGTATEGGVLVPQGLHESIIAKRDDLSIARQAGAMVIQTSVDSVQVPSENASGGFALTAEEGAANQSEPTFTSNAIQVYKFTNLTKVSDELLADEKTNLEGFLGDMWARSAADVENEYFLKGTGSSQPKGVLVGGTAALTLDSATTIAASEIPELFYLLPGAYAQEGDSVAWATNQSTLAVIRGLTGNDFLFMPTPMGGGASGAGQELYGQPVYTSSQILAMASGRSVIVVGNWKYYGIVERNEIVISRNPYLYQANGQVGFFVNIRFGGDVLQSEAFQYAQNA